MGEIPDKKPAGEVSASGDGTAHIEDAAVLVDFDQLPQWAQQNPYIRSGYRPIAHCLTGCLSSLTYWHNESGNIFSHLLPIFPLLYLIGRSVLVLTGQIATYSNPRREDVVVFAAFFAGGLACMSLSATYHTLMCHSDSVMQRCKQLDYSGITCLIWGSFMPTIYYLFTCEAYHMRLYLITMSSIAVGMVAFFLSPLAQKSWTVPFSAPMFVAFAASAFTPLWTGLQMYGWEHLNDMIGLKWVLLQGAIYLIGILFFLTEMPERAFPGKFDFLASSHQLFHTAVVLAASVQFYGLLKAYEFQHAHLQCTLPRLTATWYSWRAKNGAAGIERLKKALFFIQVRPERRRGKSALKAIREPPSAGC
ncbi:hypothetical protein KC316_g2198 [Hortaea werneckii]|nr:hypothetical protein KC324_g767 [Hortaea werneckii]KAI7592632.1 hypothetical protein KC316_g2198 [Hortaea werneckii]